MSVATFAEGDAIWYSPSPLTRAYAGVIAGPMRMCGDTPCYPLRDMELAYSAQHHPKSGRTTVAAAAADNITKRTMSRSKGGRASDPEQVTANQLSVLRRIEHTKVTSPAVNGGTVRLSVYKALARKGLAVVAPRANERTWDIWITPRGLQALAGVNLS
jgi:hypothetical protein